MNEHLPTTEPINQEKETALKDSLISEVPSAVNMGDLAEIKRKSLALDLRTSYSQEVHATIVKRFEELLRDATQAAIAEKGHFEG